MPVIIPAQLPATKALQDNNIFVMNDITACKQDIRPLKIGILNLMPDKITTENQLLRQLSNSIIQIDITLIAIHNHTSKNTSPDHLQTFYKSFNDIKNDKFDALIITGAPIEHLEFEKVSYWNELQEIFNWTKTNSFTTLFICWGAQAALYHFYQIEKEEFQNKLFGVYKHQIINKHDKLFTGLNDTFYTPHSRNSQSIQEAINNNSNLDVLATSNKAGIHIIANKERSQLFFNGHFEYDADTLLKEYQRDLQANLTSTLLPENYFTDDNSNRPIKRQWFSDASLIFLNWLNYYVYQETPYSHVEVKQNGSKKTEQ